MKLQLGEESCAACRASASEYLDGHLTGEQVRQLTSHIVDCNSCNQFVQSLSRTVSMLNMLLIRNSSDSAAQIALECYRDYYPEPRELEGLTTTKRLWGELCILSPANRLWAIRTESRYQNAALFRWLVTRSRLVSVSHPERALPLAATAVEIARSLSRAREQANCLPIALDALAKCLLALQDFESTETVLRELQECLKSVEQRGQLQQRYLTTRGYLYALTGRVDEGCRLLSEVLEMKKRQGRREEVMCALINLACGLLQGDGRGRAIGMLRKALALIDAEVDPPRVQLSVHTSLVLAYCEAGRPEEAMELLPAVWRLVEVVGGWYVRVYARWLEGTLARVQERFEEAERIFESVASEFLSRGHLVWFVEASLDLARTYLQSGRGDRLHLLAKRMESSVGESAVDERIRQAVDSFSAAVEKQTISEGVLMSLVAAVGSHGASARIVS